MIRPAPRTSPPILRSRIIGAFALAALTLGPLTATALLFIYHEFHEWQARQTLEARLETVARFPGDYNAQRVAGDPPLYVVGNIRNAPPSAAMLAMVDGVHEYQSDERAYLVAVTSEAGRRYAVIEVISVIESGERFGFAAAGVLCVMALALILANLVRNTLQHFGGDRLLIRLTEQHLLVADNGSWAGGADSEDDAAGTGIGLSLVERLATRFGGRIRIAPAQHQTPRCTAPESPGAQAPEEPGAPYTTTVEWCFRSPGEQG